MKTNHSLVLLISLSTFFACTSTKMKTQKMEGYDEKIESLVVSTLFSEYFEKAAPSFLEGIKANLIEDSIAIDYYPYPEIKNDSLDPEIQMEIILNRVLMKGLEYESSHALLIVDTKLETVSRSSSTTHTHSLIGLLIDIKKERFIWQADITLKSGDYGNSNQSGTSLAKKTISQLRKDQFLKPEGYTITRN